MKDKKSFKGRIHARHSSRKGIIEGSLQLRQKEKEYEKMSKNSIKWLTKEKKYDKFIHE